MVDLETGLEIGDPYKLPFGDVDLSVLQENVEKRIRFGVASASGIRQIFDRTHGDEPTDYLEGTSTEITDAAKIHVATVADCFVELLREQTKKSSPTVVVAIDSRHTGPAIADIAIRVLASHGVNVRYTFITPITGLAVYSKEVGDGFIYISASHNPKGYNGLKLGLNDGRVLPGHLARPFIEKYQLRLKRKENTRAMVHRLNGADPCEVRQIYEGIDLYRSELRRHYADLSDRIITGLSDPQEVAKRKESIRAKIVEKDIWLGIDPNGGARKDKEYLESWGFHVLEINGRPRLDMVHDLSPVPYACEQAKQALIDLQKEGKNAFAFFVFDTDGDRKNIVIPDGKGGAVIPGVQIIFALDIISRILSLGPKDKEIRVVVNDATSSIMEQLAYYLGFGVRRVESGEANVAEAGLNLSNQGIYVPIMGEGSNGSVFDLDLLVREPLHTVRTIIDFITKPELTIKLLGCLNQRDRYDDWYSPQKISGLLANIINALPPSRTTDLFTDEGVRRSKYDLPQRLFKDNFDEYFESKLSQEIADLLARNYGGKPIIEFVNYEGTSELHGRGNRKTGTGGYKIEFYIQRPDGSRRHIGWIWFRVSGTEIGIMRRGVSISHWEITPEAHDVVNRTYEYMNGIFNDALDIIERRLAASNRH